MNTITPEIRTVSSDQQESACVRTFVEAFRHDPAARWLFPDDRTYDAAFAEFARAFAGPAFTHGTVDFLEHAAAAWFTPDVHGDDEKVIAVLQRNISTDLLDEAFSLFEQMDAFHPKVPHYYPPLIGVKPGHQNQGIGSALLEKMLEECDRSGTPAYLEASSTTSLPFYERHGFRRIGSIQAGSSPVLYPMIRNSR